MNSVFRNIALVESNDIVAKKSMYNIHAHFFQLFPCQNQGRGREFVGKGSTLEIRAQIYTLFFHDTFSTNRTFHTL